LRSTIPPPNTSSITAQALSARYLFQAGQSLPPGVYDVPLEIDERVASLKLQALGIRLDTLNDMQRSYQNAWQLGTV
jgi:adenosylhomocysteinase